MVIFGAGVVTGGLLVKYSDQAHPARNTRNPTVAARPFTPFSAGGIRIEFLRRAERELDLSPQQKEQIDRIIAASQERTRKIMEPVSPSVREELKHTKDEFRSVLSADQQARFDEMVKAQQRPRDQHHNQSSPPKSSTDSVGTIEGAPKHP